LSLKIVRFKSFWEKEYRQSKSQEKENVINIINENLFLAILEIF